MSTCILEEMPSVKPPRARRTLRTVVFFAIVFVTGSLTGAGLSALYLQPAPTPTTSSFHSRGFSEGFVSYMREEYDLSDEQTEKLKTVVRENNERVDQINKEFRPKFGQSIERMNSEIAAMMSVEQQEKFKKKLEEMRARWANRRNDSRREGSRSSHSFGGSKSPSKLNTAPKSSEIEQKNERPESGSSQGSASKAE